MHAEAHDRPQGEILTPELDLAAEAIEEHHSIQVFQDFVVPIMNLPRFVTTHYKLASFYIPAVIQTLYGPGEGPEGFEGTTTITLRLLRNASRLAIWTNQLSKPVKVRAANENWVFADDLTNPIDIDPNDRLFLEVEIESEVSQSAGNFKQIQVTGALRAGTIRYTT